MIAFALVAWTLAVAWVFLRWTLYLMGTIVLALSVLVAYAVALPLRRTAAVTRAVDGLVLVVDRHAGRVPMPPAPPSLPPDATWV